MAATTKPTKRATKAAVRTAKEALQRIKPFDDWCRDLTPQIRAVAEQHPGGLRGFYEEHPARLRELIAKAEGAL